jgi:hypothetical protein
MPWKVPQGYSIGDLLEELDVDIRTLPEIPQALNEANAKIRKRGCAPMAENENFGKLSSAIFHYQKLKEEVANDLWDLIDRGYRYFSVLANLSRKKQAQGQIFQLKIWT